MFAAAHAYCIQTFPRLGLFVTIFLYKPFELAITYAFIQQRLDTVTAGQ
jgi:hypothetical protein